MRIMKENFTPILEFLGLKTKEWYIQRIVKFILNMTPYEGEWKKGFYHSYDIHIQDLIPQFTIFSMISDNGDLFFKGYDDLSESEVTIKGEKHLSRKNARKIYRILKKINIFS